MAKLVILNQGMTGRTIDLTAERTTVGRVEDNTFQISDPSVSSRHAEILLRGTDIIIKDSNSTNGTLIDGERISEAALKPGQILRFGQVELKIDDGKPLAATTSTPATAMAPAKAHAENTTRPAENTLVIPRGVSLEQLERGAGIPQSFDTSSTFSKKTNKTNKYFVVIGLIVGLVIVGFIIFLLKKVNAR
ncbi:MAG: FHA domain-containing protein [Verrucomicrobiota bacterium]